MQLSENTFYLSIWVVCDSLSVSVIPCLFTQLGIVVVVMFYKAVHPDSAQHEGTGTVWEGAENFSMWADES